MTMKKVGVAILGLGVVGGGTYKILTEHREEYQRIHKVDIVVEAVLERNREKALALGVEEGKIASSVAEICGNPEVDIVVEVMGGIEPARTYVLDALNSGKSVVTSNKELYCKYSYELEKAARKNHCGLFYEASCVGGVPVIRSLLDNLQGNIVTSMVGIINGTTNYILTKMSQDGISYEQALRGAQSLGYAEADPSSDVEGYDACYKLSILSSLAFHTKIPYTQIYREGISSIDIKDVSYGKQLGYVIKLLAIGKNGKSGIEVRVHPAFIRARHPLASVNDSFNAVYLTGDSVGEVMLYGRGAGAYPTGSAVVGDVIYCATHVNYPYSTFDNTKEASPNTRFIENFSSSYYIRLTAKDKAGVLAKVTSIFSHCSISVKQMFQEDGGEDGEVPIIFITHETKEHNVNKAVKEIAATEAADVAAVIRVVE